MSFPRDFAWGVASSAYQSEGAAFADGKGPCVWDDFCRRKGGVRHGENGDTACDAYHRADEDLRLLAELKVNAYRFSLNWARVFPEGRGRRNPRGFDFYDRLVDGLLARGIEPFVTLHHWELPSALQAKGGWLNRDTCLAFAEFAAACAEHFRGRVRRFFTINEPQIILDLGLAQGLHAPGLRLGVEDQLRAMHHLLLANGLSVSALREGCPQARVGLCSTGRICYPAQDTAENRAAAYAETFAVREDDWRFFHGWFLDAALWGRYPAAPGALGRFAEAAPAEDMAQICQRLDFLGLNLYNGREVDARGLESARVPGRPRTALKWPVTERALRYGTAFLWQRYGLPLYITENGQACNDRVFLDGKVHDPDRIDFLTRYLRQLKLAMDEGAPVLGYFHWSFTDNFEWHSGYDERFGLVYVDFSDQRRILKDSALWYRSVIDTNGHALD